MHDPADGIFPAAFFAYKFDIELVINASIES